VFGKVVILLLGANKKKFIHFS